jgi:glycosyltransferase involved in cell wall biosynthesis
MKSLYLNAGFKFSLNSKICHHGVQINNVPHNQYSSRLSFYNTDKINILIAGRIVHIKGIHVAIKAIARLINQKGYKNLSLSIVGDATDKEYFHEINELTLIHGIKDYVFFKPAVKEGELFQLFQEFDIYLFPSLYEPFSLTLILALDSGIPTIASNIGGNIELIQNYKSGLLFESNNVIDLASKIELLVLNNNLRNNISRNGILRSKQFSFKSMLINLEKIIIKFLDEYHLKFKNK